MLFPHQLPSRKQLAAVALDNVTRAFANSFDWHSSVHMHLLLVRRVEAELSAGGSLDAPGVRRELDVLMEPGLGAAVSDEYMSSHWIATFAREALWEAKRNASGGR